MRFIVRTVVQGGGDGEGDRTTTEKPLRFRDRHRQARHREFLDAARRIMTTEGRAALTMQRVTDAVGSSAGGIYVYFPSKDALMAELQREAVETLQRSYRRGQEQLDEMLDAAGAKAREAALARVLASGRFWFDATEAYPSDVSLTRNFLTPSGSNDVDEVEAERVLPAIRSLVDDVSRRIADAAARGALASGQETERAVVLITSVTVVLLTTKLGRLDTDLFDGRRLASQLVHDLAAGWGARASHLARAESYVADFTERSSLAPPADG